MSNQNYYAQPMPETHTAPSFISHLHKYGKSRMFLAGIILFTIGTVVSTLVTWTLLAFIPLALAALPITGFWFIYAESKNPQNSEKTLKALMLFKVHTIITLVLLCLFAALMLALLLFTSFLSTEVDAELMLSIIPSLFFLLIMLSLIPLYYVPILNIIKSIRQNIIDNAFNHIHGVLPFTVLTFIYVGLTVLVTALMLVGMGILIAFAINDPMLHYPAQDAFNAVAMLPMFIVLIVVFIAPYIASAIGTVFFVIILNRFAKSISNGILHNIGGETYVKSKSSTINA